MYKPRVEKFIAVILKLLNAPAVVGVVCFEPPATDRIRVINIIIIYEDFIPICVTSFKLL